MNVINLRTLAFFFWLHLVAYFNIAVAQPSSGLFRDWKEATKLLDSSSEDDRRNAEKQLRFELGSPSTPVDAAWSLALFCSKRNDLAAVERVLQGIEQKFPAPHPAAQRAILRLKLQQSIGRDAQAVDNKNQIDEFVATFQESQPIEDRILDAHFLGNIIGMFDTEASKSPLTEDEVYAIRQTFAKLPELELRTAFSQSYDAARAKASQFAARIEQLEQMGLDKANAEQTTRLAELDALRTSIEADRDAAKQISKTNEAALKEVAQERKRLEAEVARLNRESKTRTPGHPGPEKPAPVRPNRFDIYVDPLMVIEEIYTDANGKPQRRQRVVNKPYSQIELERDERFRLILIEYNSVKQDYDQYASRYRQQLETWNNSDKRRREENQKKLEQVDMLLAQARDASDQLRLQNEESAKLLGNRISQLKRLEALAEMDKVVLAALEAKKPEQLFRPGTFELFHYAKEKRRILDVTR